MSNIFRFHNHPKLAKVSIVHNVALGPEVNVLVDGKIVLKNVTYKSISNYLKVPEGKHYLQISLSNKHTILASLNVVLKANKYYTIIAHGNVKDLSSISLLALEDNICSEHGKINLRFIHAAATVPNVDILDIRNNMKNKLFSNISYGQSVDQNLDFAQDLNIVVTPANNSEIVLGPIMLKLSTNKIYTIIATGLLNDNTAPISVLISADNCR